MFKLTIEEHVESTLPLIKAKFTSLEPTKFYTFFGTPGISLQFYLFA